MKIKYLIPALGLTAVAPAVSLVSCADKNIKGIAIKTQLIYDETEGEKAFCFIAYNVTLQKDATYTIVADLSKLTKTKECSALNVLLELVETGELSDYIELQSFVVNGKTLSEITMETVLQGGWIVWDEFFWVAFPKQGETFKSEGKVYATFKAKKDITEPFKILISNKT